MLLWWCCYGDVAMVIVTSFLQLLLSRCTRYPITSHHVPLEQNFTVRSVTNIRHVQKVMWFNSNLWSDLMWMVLWIELRRVCWTFDTILIPAANLSTGKRISLVQNMNQKYCWLCSYIHGHSWLSTYNHLSPLYLKFFLCHLRDKSL